MKLISFVRCAQPGFGARVAAGIVDLTGYLVEVEIGNVGRLVNTIVAED